MTENMFNEQEKELIEKYSKETRFSVDDLLKIMAILRKGCPWDREQTHESIRMNFLEEAYEVCDAIDNADPNNLCEELGDVLLQVVFHTQLSSEEKAFEFDDVVSGVCVKLVERHPHIFGDVKVGGTADVLTNWDNIKAVEKNQTSVRKKLDDVPRALPSLIRAQKLASRAHKGGMYEYSDALSGMSREEAEEYLGEKLFELCSAAKALDIDAEEVLLRKNDEFIKEF